MVSIAPGRLVDRSRVLFRAMLENGWNYPVLLRPVAGRGVKPQQIENAAAARRYLEETDAPVIAQPLQS